MSTQNTNNTKNKNPRSSSYYILGIIGLLLLINIILIIINIKNFQNEIPYKMIIAVSLIGLVIGIYGLMHLGAKKVYYYNPFVFMKQKVFNKKQKKYKKLY
jgi:heme/copper-type cytochrome/quinol oxidase subunit 4